MTLNHIHIGTKDLKKSQQFYASVFSFRKKFDHDPGIFMENDAGFLIAIDPVEEVPVFPSWYHLGFCLPSEQEALKMYDKCKNLKTKIVRDMMHKEGQFASFFITDPDGYKIEVSWHNE